MSGAVQSNLLQPIVESPQQTTPKTWKEALRGEREMSYFKELLSYIEEERKRGQTIYPPASEVFSAMQYTDFSAVKVVILGQDPYHGPQQAHGLCFSVRRGIPAPPSLVNIFKELQSDLGCTIPKHGNLESWADQGVLLLNSVLTVKAGTPGSHANKGWEKFTDKVISIVNDQREHVVFLLWGAYAHKKGQIIDQNKHLVLKAAHPSPFSAYNGFFGCKHFSKANEYLLSHGLEAVKWQIGE